LSATVSNIFRVDFVTGSTRSILVSQDLQRGHHEIGCIQDVEHRAIRPGKPRLHHECQFGFDPRTDEAVGWHEAAIGKEHVVEKNPGIRLIDTKRALHGLRCEADLVAFDDAALPRP